MVLALPLLLVLPSLSSRLRKPSGFSSRQVHDMFDMLGRRRLFVPTAGCRACWVPTDMAQEYGNKTYTVLAFGAFRSHTTTAISLNAFNTSMNR